MDMEGVEKVVTEQEEVKPVIDELGRSYATGKRKESIARVWIKPGKGVITVNGKELNKYFSRSTAQALVTAPLVVTKSLQTFDVTATVVGGGISGQAGALKHGISKALTLYDPNNRKLLKPLGFLTRDARVVESKKYVRRKARRSFQFSKR